MIIHLVSSLVGNKGNKNGHASNHSNSFLEISESVEHDANFLNHPKYDYIEEAFADDLLEIVYTNLDDIRAGRPPNYISISNLQLNLKAVDYWKKFILLHFLQKQSVQPYLLVMMKISRNLNHQYLNTILVRTSTTRIKVILVKKFKNFFQKEIEDVLYRQ